MGSKTFDGVRFAAFSHDHVPPHVHGTIAGVVVIVALLSNREVDLADRDDAIKPTNAKRNVVTRILRIATENVDELNALWEKTHGSR